jgi:hypothetical protein
MLTPMEVIIPLRGLTFYDTQEYLFSYKTNSGIHPPVKKEVKKWLP